MKRALQFKTCIILLTIPFLVFANPIKDKHTKTKTINKVFTVNSNANLKVNNSYGNIDIVTWNENKITIDVTITTSGNNEDNVIKKLNDIDVEFSATPEMVSAQTIFDKKSSNSWWNWNNKNNVNMKINYVIKMPITGSVKLSNDYGNINLDKLEGRAEINCDYGKITTKELMADNNVLNFDYTQNSYFEYIKSGKINADYSGFTVSKAKMLNINADYTNSTVQIVEDINYNCDYGKMTIEKANNINGNGDYLTTLIGDVYKDVSIKADYGSVKINRMTENAGNISITSDYVGIKIGFAPNYHFNFDLDLDYGSLNGEDLQITKKLKESSHNHYSGYYGKSSTNNTIKVVSDYGSVTLFKN